MKLPGYLRFLGITFPGFVDASRMVFVIEFLQRLSATNPRSSSASARPLPCVVPFSPQSVAESGQAGLPAHRFLSGCP